MLSGPFFRLAFVFSRVAVVRRCSVKKVFLEILQNLQENTSARVSFLIKLQASRNFSLTLTSEEGFLSIIY